MIVDMMTKLAFGIVLLPSIYLFGFLLRHNSDNVFKNLGLMLYFLGHLMNMLVLTLDNP